MMFSIIFQDVSFREKVYRISLFNLIQMHMNLQLFKVKFNQKKKKEKNTENCLCKFSTCLSMHSFSWLMVFFSKGLFEYTQWSFMIPSIIQFFTGDTVITQTTPTL